MKTMMTARMGKTLRENLEAVGLLKTVEYGVRYAVHPLADGRAIFSCWTARSTKPVRHWMMAKPEYAEQWLAEIVANEKARAESVAAEKVEKTKKVAAMQAALTVGSLLCYSWGWEQTNIEFFEVVKKTGASVWLRKIAQKTVRATGPMQAEVKPVPGQYTSEKIVRKTITPYGVSFDHGIATPTTVDRGHHASWYA